jgi:hypothetical protein
MKVQVMELKLRLTLKDGNIPYWKITPDRLSPFLIKLPIVAIYHNSFLYFIHTYVEIGITWVILGIFEKPTTKIPIYSIRPLGKVLPAEWSAIQIHMDPLYVQVQMYLPWRFWVTELIHWPCVVTELPQRVESHRLDYI